ncbi:MAG: hypothetical protein MHM6MM_000251 [Cercozoa sp. M6MM]
MSRFERPPADLPRRRFRRFGANGERRASSRSQSQSRSRSRQSQRSRSDMHSVRQQTEAARLDSLLCTAASSRELLRLFVDFCSQHAVSLLQPHASRIISRLLPAFEEIFACAPLFAQLTPAFAHFCDLLRCDALELSREILLSCMLVCCVTWDRRERAVLGESTSDKRLESHSARAIAHLASQLSSAKSDARENETLRKTAESNEIERLDEVRMRIWSILRVEQNPHVVRQLASALLHVSNLLPRVEWERASAEHLLRRMAARSLCESVLQSKWLRAQVQILKLCNLLLASIANQKKRATTAASQSTPFVLLLRELSLFAVAPPGFLHSDSEVDEDADTALAAKTRSLALACLTCVARSEPALVHTAPFSWWPFPLRLLRSECTPRVRAAAASLLAHVIEASRCAAFFRTACISISRKHKGDSVATRLAHLLQETHEVLCVVLRAETCVSTRISLLRALVSLCRCTPHEAVFSLTDVRMDTTRVLRVLSLLLRETCVSVGESHAVLSALAAFFDSAGECDREITRSLCQHLLQLAWSRRNEDPFPDAVSVLTKIAAKHVDLVLDLCDDTNLQSQSQNLLRLFEAHFATGVANDRDRAESLELLRLLRQLAPHLRDRDELKHLCLTDLPRLQPQTNARLRSALESAICSVLNSLPLREDESDSIDEAFHFLLAAEVNTRFRALAHVASYRSERDRSRAVVVLVDALETSESVAKRVHAVSALAVLCQTLPIQLVSRVVNSLRDTHCTTDSNEAEISQRLHAIATLLASLVETAVRNETSLKSNVTHSKPSETSLKSSEASAKSSETREAAIEITENVLSLTSFLLRCSESPKHKVRRNAMCAIGAFLQWHLACKGTLVDSLVRCAVKAAANDANCKVTVSALNALTGTLTMVTLSEHHNVCARVCLQVARLTVPIRFRSQVQTAILRCFDRVYDASLVVCFRFLLACL